MALAKAPPPGTSFMGLAWVGPGLILYGTDDQKRRLIPDILDSAVCWCTGYSEPNHGSDLAAIQCKAELDDDRHFAEIFFTAVRVLVSDRLGAEGEGWKVTVSALANERFSIGEVTQMFDKLDTLREQVKGTTRQGQPAASAPLVRRTLARFAIRIAAMRYNGLRDLTRQLGQRFVVLAQRRNRRG